MENENKNLTSSIEALLFAYGEPMEIKKIGKILGISEEAIKTALGEFEKELSDDRRGLKLIFNENRVQLATKPEFSRFLEDFIKEEFSENLTPASLETLSLIMYFGPISRAKIDYFRGVNSSFILRNLMMRGLVERATEAKERGGYLYQPTFDLLKYLGVSKIEELPEYEKFKKFSLDFESVQTGQDSTSQDLKTTESGIESGILSNQ
ncbi:MAG: SMC-Scp complex subunit ScpB [Patescibacteria group bacterium]